jgi:hypothetical protein
VIQSDRSLQWANGGTRDFARVHCLDVAGELPAFIILCCFGCWQWVDATQDISSLQFQKLFEPKKLSSQIEIIPWRGSWKAFRRFREKDRQIHRLVFWYFTCYWRCVSFIFFEDFVAWQSSNAAKAWRLQEVAGEGDSVRWRSKRDDLADDLQKSVRARRPTITVPDQDSDSFFTDGTDASYSMTDDDLGAALSGRLSELANGVKSPLVRHKGLLSCNAWF